MCCFSRPVRFVGKTRIFARALPNDEQLLVYAMDLDIEEELAMVLPVPVPRGVADDAVTFVDLEGYASFFDDLGSAFPADYTTLPQAKARGPALRSAPKLVVHDVGMFEASFVPTRADFARLDPRFRLPDGVWDALPNVASFGFAVFRLKPKKRSFLGLGSAMQRVHPMAFRFPRRDAEDLFFPTLHVHDGRVAREAAFDHTLFCQVEGVLAATLGWTTSTRALGHAVDVGRARGIVDGEREGFRLGLHGRRQNDDVVLRPPRGVGVHDLLGAGECHSFRLAAAWAYPDHDVEAERAAWTDTARTNMASVARALREGLPALVARRRSEWELGALHEGLAPHFMNGPSLWSGTSYVDGAPAHGGGSGRLVLRPFTSRVEPQEVVLGFASLPRPERLGRIFAEVRALLEAAVG